jgi:ribose transport system permease protein
MDMRTPVTHNQNEVAVLPIQPAEDLTTVQPQRTKSRFKLPEAKNYTGVLAIIIVAAVFTGWIPDLFFTATNLRVLLQGQAVPAVLALGLLLPVAAGMFDLSVAACLGLSCACSVWFVIHGYPTVIAVLAPIALGAAIGGLNSVILLKFKVDPFIGTLGMSSILTAGAYWVTTGNQLVVTGTNPLSDFSVRKFFGLPSAMYVLVAVAAVLWFTFRFRPAGRFIHATGANDKAAHLAGVRVTRVRAFALIFGGAISASAGVLLAGQLGSATPDMGSPYLLPAFTAVLLGATQVIPGRVNVIGTLIAIYLLATGVDGLQLAGAPSYVNNLFNGVALVVAVAFAVRLRSKSR